MPGVGVMPVICVVLSDPLAIAFPVVGFTAVIAAPVTGLRDALVKKPGLVVTPFTAAAIVGVTAVTTVWPGAPVTSPMTFVKVGVTLVTHVAAEAEDISAALRPPTEIAARSVWFGPDSNIASDQVVALRSTTDVLIRAPQRSARDLESRA